MIQSLIAHKLEVVTGLFLFSEILALVPSIQANSIFQLISDLLKKAKDAVTPVQVPAAQDAPKV